MALEEKTAFVCDWLSSHGISSDFEINEDTVTKLYETIQNKYVTRLEKSNFKQEEGLFQREMLHYYEMEKERVGRVNTSCGIVMEKLSKSGAASLTMLTQLAEKLELKNVSKDDFVLGINEHLMMCEKTTMEQMELKRLILAATKQNTELKTLLHSLEQQYETHISSKNSELPKLRQKEVEIESLKQITTSEKNVLINFQNIESSVQDISHSELKNFAQKILKKQEALKPLQVSVQGYCGLPPDITLAKKEIERAKSELLTLQHKIQSSMDDLRDQFM